MSAGGWTRRGVLGLLVLGGGALAGRLLWRHTRPLESSVESDRFRESLHLRPPEGDRFQGLLLESSHAATMSAEFGRLYLEQRDPTDIDLTTLAAEVMARLETVRPWRRLREPLGLTDLEERLGEAIAADFLTEDGICQLDGWYLAQTECRLAAMKFLAPS